MEQQQQQSEDSSSLWMIKASELFPKERAEKEEDNLQINFTELPGESIKYIGKCENGKLAISNYRLYLSNIAKSFETSIPLRLIETVQIKEIFQLIVSCKDAVTYVLSFASAESCNEWYGRISSATLPPDQLENLFAFPFHAWVSECTTSLDQEWFNRLQHATDYDEYFQRELERLQFDLKGAWRVSTINADFKLCSSYPTKLIVPACISDETLTSVSNFRSSRRIPVVTWRHSSGAVISRCSQPEVGWLGWRNNKDEQLLKALADACSFDNGTTSPKTEVYNDSSDTSQTENVDIDKPKKILIVDARSYASAVTNRARGGGVECAEYYPSAEIQFMNLGNIHVIRKSFQAIRQLCALDMDIPNWYSLLEKTSWLQHISGLLSASNIVCHAVEKNNRPVLIHCSDGWDRTPQISSTAQLLLDPFYRTIEGFKILVEKEWLSFGHKFGDRVGHGVGSEDTNERCPVFLQWIDCIHQIHHQFPCSFEFSKSFLIKLAQHAHSCLFGTFLCNTLKERIENSIPDRTFSVWPFLSAAIYKNPLYQPNRERVLWPSHNLRNLIFWSDFYLGSFHTQTNGNLEISNDTVYTENSLIKTRSFDDLVSEVKSKENSLVRRLSDPSIVFGDNNMPLTVSIFQENSNGNSKNNAETINTVNEMNGDTSTITNCDKSSDGDDEEVEEEEEEDNNNNNNNDDGEKINGHDNNNKDIDDEKVCEIRENSIENDALTIEENQKQIICDDSNKDKDEIDGHKFIERDTNIRLNDFNGKIAPDNLEKVKFNNHHMFNGHKFNGSDTKSKKESTSSNDSQFSTPALRSTTPAILDRNIFLPDGLNHGLTDENLRLQQLVYEHKLKEETLQNELYMMRLALLKTASCQCNNNQNNKTHSANVSDDLHPENCNSENSICSWEAVDEKKHTPTITPWIPDNARTKCKNCQIEFWLGRRRHHCRLCLEIFCGDCSDHFAQLPNNNETFQSPVRLCSHCFKSIVEKENN